MKSVFILIAIVIVSCSSNEEKNVKLVETLQTNNFNSDSINFDEDSVLLNGKISLVTKIDDVSKSVLLNGKITDFKVQKENEFGENSFSISSKNNYIEIQRGFFCFISLKDSLLNINGICVGSDSSQIWRKFHNIKKDPNELGTYVINLKKYDSFLYFRINGGKIKEIGFNGLCN